MPEEFPQDIVALNAIEDRAAEIKARIPAPVDGDTTGVSEPVTATGTITLAGVPANNDTLTVNGVVLTFKTVATLPEHVDISSNDVPTILGLLNAALFAVDEPALNDAEYANNSVDTLTITHVEPGVIGNDFTLAKTSDQVAISGSTLEGGADAGADPIEPLLPVAIRLAAEGGSVAGGTVTNPLCFKLVDGAGNAITFVSDGAGGWLIPVVVVEP